jgi:hypothetical protein
VIQEKIVDAKVLAMNVVNKHIWPTMDVFATIVGQEPAEVVIAIALRARVRARARKLNRIVHKTEVYYAYREKCAQSAEPQVKQTVFKTRDANSAINIMNLTKCWIEKQERPACFQISSFTSSNIQKEDEKVRPS